MDFRHTEEDEKFRAEVRSLLEEICPREYRAVGRQEVIEYVKQSKLDGELLQVITAWKIATGMKLRSESSVVKIFLTEFARRVGEFGIVISGPIAPLLPGHQLTPLNGEAIGLWTNNVASTIAGGSNEIQRNIIALQGLGLPRD